MQLSESVCHPRVQQAASTAASCFLHAGGAAGDADADVSRQALVLTLAAHISLQGEQEEYVREGIKWSYVDFIDNQETLDLLEGGQVP